MFAMEGENPTFSFFLDALLREFLGDVATLEGFFPLPHSATAGRRQLGAASSPKAVETLWVCLQGALG